MTILDKLRMNQEPSVMDSITVEVDGITVDVYGILHGITGGSNKDYIKAVNRTIAESKGVKFCEKSMKSMYVGLDHDVRDWFAFRPIDTFNFAFRSTVNPKFIAVLISTIFREKKTKHSRFGENDIYTLNDMGGSMKFHTISPVERREIAGFPSPIEYMWMNYLRRHSSFRKGIRFSDKDWEWLNYIEPNANIPYRSVHMIEYVIAYCKLHKIKSASLFCGEIHNSDIEWYVSCRSELPGWLIGDASKIKQGAIELANNDNLKKVSFIKYLSVLTLGAVLSSSIYWAVILSALLLV